MHKQFEKALDLVRKNNDRLILYNVQDDNDAHVVMSLDEYDRLTTGQSREVKGLTEDELVDKINRDIAVWKSGQETLPDEGAELSENSQNKTENKQKGTAKSSAKDGRKNQWGIPPTRKQAAAEIIEDEEMNNEENIEDDDRQYLEEVTF
jgi:hypothetical protein